VKTYLLIASAVAACALPTASNAQFGGLGAIGQLGGLGNKAPANHGAAPSASVDPDRFLHDTIETTKYVMIAAAILHDAASAAPDEVALANRLKAINDVNDVKELDTHRVEMDQDIAAINSNQDLSARIKANMRHASAQQRARLAGAAFNFALGVYRNAQLAAEAPKVVDSIKYNPMQAMKAPKLLMAAHLVMDEAQQTAGMVGSLHAIMTAGNIATPTPSETTAPQPVDLG
jgi:hypothetical protein